MKRNSKILRGSRPAAALQSQGPDSMYWFVSWLCPYFLMLLAWKIQCFRRSYRAISTTAVSSKKSNYLLFLQSCVNGRQQACLE